MNLKSKLFASAVAFSMVLGAVAIPASAATTAELTAQINALLAQIAQLQAQIGGGSVVAGTTFTTDLTVGSKGADVVALQTWLVSKGHLVMPVGVAMGYFGPLTKAAVATYQTSVGITPAVGYFGPITRAKVNAVAGAGTTTGTTGTTGTTVPAGSITTPGAEGTIAATESSAGTVSTVYEGDSMAPILGIKVEASGSDMAVQRIKFDLDESAGSDTKFYNKAYKKLYVTEGGNVLASIDLNSSTVIKDGTDYFVTIAGFNSVIPKGGSKTYLIKADAFSAIDSTDAALTFTLAVAANGVRAVDGAGIDQYSGTTAIAASPDIAASLAESATLTVSLNSSTPKKTDVVCTSGSSENECDKLSVLVFDMKAEKDSVKITDMNIAVAKAGTGGATASTTVYLYEGSSSTELANATVGSLNTAVFSDLDYTIAKDVTKTFTVKVDIDGANSTISNFTASASSTGITDENSQGDSVTDSGTATGNQVGVLNVGPEFSLVSKSITTSGTPQDNVSGTASISTSTITATFNIKVKAVGGPLEFGTTQATSTAGAFVSSTTGFTIFRDGSSDATISSNATSTSITFPSTCTTSGYTNSCQLAEGSDTTVAVSFQLQGRKTSSAVFTPGLYSVGIARLNWVNVSTTGGMGNTTFMSGEADWRTSEVSFP